MADEWRATVTHPDTSRTIRADALTDPTIEPSLNVLPEIRYPVPRSFQWQELPDDTSFTVLRNGAEQPIGVLWDVHDERTRGRAVLEGRGGTDLLDQVEIEYGSERRHVAAEEVINDHTPYDADVDTPTATVLSDEDMQDPSGESGLQSVLPTLDATAPLEFANGGIQTTQTAFPLEGENADRDNQSRISDPSNLSDYSGGDAAYLSRGTGATGGPDFAEWDFTLAHEIPADDFAFQYRMAGGGSEGFPAYTVELQHANGNTYTLDSLNSLGVGGASLRWRDDEFWNATGYGGPDLSAGDYTIRIQVDSSGGTADDYYLYVDLVCPYDARWNHDAAGTGNDFDDTVAANGYLDDPQLHPWQRDVTFTPARTPFQVIAGDVTVTMDDTSNGQRILLRNTAGGSFGIGSGSSFATTFPNAGDRIQLRVTLSRYAPNGAQDATPRFGYSPQTLTAYDLDADIRQESLLLDYSKDQSVADHLSDIAGQSFIWSFRTVNGTDTVTVTQPGQRTATADADLIDATVTKELRRVHEVTVEGSNRQVSGEQFEASVTYQNLAYDDLVSGSESVRDPDDGTQFDRDEDYEMDWSSGRVRTVDDGDMVAGDTYEISYRAEIRGTYTDPAAPSGYNAEKVEIPGVTSERNAEQIAYVLVQDLKEPRWVGEITIPPSAADFDVVDALPLEGIGLPSSAGPFTVVGRPTVTPQGTTFRLGNRRDLEARLRQIRSQVSAVVGRTG